MVRHFLQTRLIVLQYTYTLYTVCIRNYHSNPIIHSRSIKAVGTYTLKYSINTLQRYKHLVDLLARYFEEKILNSRTLPIRAPS